MDQNQLSEIRKHILETNPEIPPERLSDAKIEEAIAETSHKPEQREFAHKIEAKRQVASSGSPEADSKLPISPPQLGATSINKGETISFILNEMSGNSGEIRTDNPNVASRVDELFGLQNDNDKVA